jgi:hypothetical protein
VVKQNVEIGDEIMDVGDETPWHALLAMCQEWGIKQCDLHVVNAMRKVEVTDRGTQGLNNRTSCC